MVTGFFQRCSAGDGSFKGWRDNGNTLRAKDKKAATERHESSFVKVAAGTAAAINIYANLTFLIRS